MGVRSVKCYHLPPQHSQSPKQLRKFIYVGSKKRETVLPHTGTLHVFIALYCIGVVLCCIELMYCIVLYCIVCTVLHCVLF